MSYVHRPRSTIFLSAIAFSTLGILFVYVSIQQVYRQNANDPQIQLAEDAASALNSGKGLYDSFAPGAVAIETGLSPYVLVYDKQGKAIAGSGLLHGVYPTLPGGVFSGQKGGVSGENRITWQPESGVRQALVIVPYKDGFVVSGRSLRESEARTQQLGTFALIAWVCSLVGSILYAWLAVKSSR